jgi:hypothetical protein
VEDYQYYLGPAATLLGIMFASCFATVGYLLRWKHESKKCARRVLYLLLQIRFAASKSLFDPDEATEAYVQHFIKLLKGRGISAEPSVITPPLREKIQGHLQTVFELTRENIEGDLLKKYEESLYELSAQNPVLAFQLQGKDKLSKLLDATKNYNQSYQADLKSSDDPVLTDVLSPALKKQEPSMLNGVVEVVEEDLILLSKYCGYRHYKACQKQIAYKPFVSGNYDFSQLDSKILGLIDNLSEHLNKQQDELLANKKFKSDSQRSAP